MFELGQTDTPNQLNTVQTRCFKCYRSTLHIISCLSSITDDSISLIFTFLLRQLFKSTEVKIGKGYKILLERTKLAGRNYKKHQLPNEFHSFEHKQSVREQNKED